MTITINDLPRFLAAGDRMRVGVSGVYIFTGTVASSWTVALGAPTSPRRKEAAFYFVKNEGTAILTLNASSPNNFYDGSSSSSIAIAPGGGVTLLWDGTNYAVMSTMGRTFADSSGTPGAQTAVTRVGRCSIAAAGTSVVVTNALCTINSVVVAVVATNDATALIKNVVPAAGSFTVTLNAAATATTNINWQIVT